MSGNDEYKVEQIHVESYMYYSTTEGSGLFELRLSKHLGEALFSAAAGKKKHILVTGVLLQEKAKVLYEQLFSNATMPFTASTEYRPQFIKSKLLSKATLTIVQRGTLRGRVSRSNLGFNHSHVID